ncbi:MAG: cache domain-containing protein, partial [Pirellulales bacterium]
MSESTRRRFSLISGSLSLLANKLLLSLLAVSLIPLAITGALMYRTAVESLRSQSFKQLETVRTITAKSVERYFSSMEDQLRIMAEDRMVIDALKQFTDGYQSILREDDVDDASIELARKDLSTYYTGDFSTEYLRQTGNETAVQPLLDGLPNATAWLQDLYIRQNDNPLGSKHLLDAAGDGSSYSQAHQTFHPIFRNVLSRLGIYDFFLIDAQSGTIVYSVFKELDFATSLLNGSFSSTTFAKAYKEALSSGRRDTVAFGPFEQYLPSYEAPASFIAAPVYEGRQILGVVVFQLPIEQMNAIIGERVGMGKTGETYAVGPDRLFRSESRFTSDLGVKTTIINPE